MPLLHLFPGSPSPSLRTHMLVTPNPSDIDPAAADPIAMVPTIDPTGRPPFFGGELGGGGHGSLSLFTYTQAFAPVRKKAGERGWPLF